MAGSASAARPCLLRLILIVLQPIRISQIIRRNIKVRRLSQVQPLMVIPIIAAVQRRVRVVQAPITIIVNLKDIKVAAMRVQAMVQVVAVQVTTITLHQIRQVAVAAIMITAVVPAVQT